MRKWLLKTGRHSINRARSMMIDEAIHGSHPATLPIVQLTLWFWGGFLISLYRISKSRTDLTVVK